jgi:hypothetical protein
MRTSAWVLLSYRLPREPSTPRIALWRKLRQLGAAQLLDGLVALPDGPRTREQFEWLAEQVVEAGGTAEIWLARPGTAGHGRELAAQMKARAAEEYVAVTHAARDGLGEEQGKRKRTLARLRREMRRIRRRDYFPPRERDEARAAVDELAQALDEVTA